MSNTVYQELVKTKIVTNLIISCVDVASNQNTATPVYVSVSVPQSTEANSSRGDKTFSTVITGSGGLQVSYPRYKNADDKANGVENMPVVSVKYYQNAQEETWKACFNQDNEAKNYAFRDTKNDGIDMKIGSGEYSISLYGKATKLNMPMISGQLSSKEDGQVVSMMASTNGTDFNIDCGEVTTDVQIVGDNERHGVFSGLGQGVTWTDTNYEGKNAIIYVDISVGEEKKVSKKPLRSNQSNYTVQL